MAGWGEVLEAMHLAPRGVRTVRLVVEQQRGAPDPAGGGPLPDGTIGISTTIVVSSMSSTLATGGAGEGTWGPFRSEVRYEPATGRYRLDHATTSILFDGRRLWSPMGDGRIHVQEATAGGGQHLERLLVAPEVLLAWFAFTAVADGEHLGRPVHVLTGTRRPTGNLLTPLLDLVLPGRDVRAAVDAGTGVLLSLGASTGDGPPSRLDVTEVGFDDFDPDEVLTFEPGPGATLLTTEDLRREHEARGTQVVRARFDASQHAILQGPPPDDPDAEREAIRHAVEHLTDIDEHDRCPNIQGGENLAECVRRTRQSPFVDEGGATFACGTVHFVRADEAVVHFRVEVPRAPMGGIDTEGRALLVGGRWVVDRVTACRLFSMAGVTCPPPPPPAA